MDRPLRITFLLPLAGDKPIGGFRVVYEYANYLSSKGHDVSIVHPARLLIDEPLHRMRPRQAVKNTVGYFRYQVTGEFRPTAWMRIHPSVKLLWKPSLAARFVPDADVVVATAWQTAEWAASYPEAKGRKYYLIQHLETWSGPEERVLATWKLPFTKIVIAQWLKEKAEEMGENACLVHNGLDFERFHVTVPMDQRDPNSILMPYHTLDWKGSADALKAFEIARESEPELQLNLFGVAPKPAELPSGARYYQNPTQDLLRELYNKASIFVAASWTEGFSLPPAEALQCGAAIVLTDIAGPAAYAKQGETALLSPVKDPPALAANLLRLVREPELRFRLARQGNALIQSFTWERAGSSLEGILYAREAEAALSAV